MESNYSFVQEIAVFLRTLSDFQTVPLSMEMPFSAFYFHPQHLLIHCIPLLPGLGKYSPDTFVTLTEKYAAQDIKVVHLWEDVWRQKERIVRSRLSALLKKTQRIPARLTQVQRIDKPTLAQFLNLNHLQVFAGAKYKYGLFLPPRYFRVLGEQAVNSTADAPLLVAVASFSGGKNFVRTGEPYRSFELIRFANLLDCTVVGGLDKLLSAFIKEARPDDIMTYADRDWSDGSSYERLGFERLGTTPPQGFWVNPETFERVSENRPGRPENEIKIFNAGNIKYLLDLKKNPK